MGNIRWNNEEINYLKENAGEISIYELCNNLNRTRVAIKQKVVKLGLSTRFLQRDKYNIDHSFFKKMTPQLSHFIGFWYADGNIYDNTISFCLAKKDKEFLQELFSQFSDINIKSYKHRPNEYRGEFGDKKLSTLLRNKYNFIPNKSLICEFPKYIPDKYLKYFLQGYFEGDGWIAKINRYVGFVSGSHLFIEGLELKLQNLGFTSVVKEEYPNTDYHKIRLNVRDSIDFLDLIYKKPIRTVIMNRKYKLYKDIKRYRDNKEKYITLWTLSKMINKDNQTLYNWRKRYNITADKIDYNGYCYYSKPTINTWFKKMEKNIEL